MPVHPCLRRRRRICPHVASVAVRQIQGEEVGLLLDTADHHDRFAEIGLGTARCMIKRNEHLPMPPTVLPNIVFDDGVAALETMLVAKPLEDPLGGMPLLARSLPILRQPLVDDPGEPIQLWPPDRCRPPIARWDRKRQNLPNAVTRYPEMPGRFSLTHALGTGRTHLAIQIHGEDPPALPPSNKERQRWTTFTPPAAGSSRRYHGRLSHRRSHCTLSSAASSSASFASLVTTGSPGSAWTLRRSSGIGRPARRGCLSWKRSRP